MRIGETITLTCRRAAYLALALIASGPLVACGDPGVFDRVETRADASGADWPRLADTPPAPPLGVHTEDAPDPAAGETARIELGLAAETAETRRRAIAGPVE